MNVLVAVLVAVGEFWFPSSLALVGFSEITLVCTEVRVTVVSGAVDVKVVVPAVTVLRVVVAARVVVGVVAVVLGVSDSDEVLDSVCELLEVVAADVCELLDEDEDDEDVADSASAPRLSSPELGK